MKVPVCLLVLPLVACGSSTPGNQPDLAVASPDLIGQNSVCGNGVLEPGEQCDDGNRFDLDGCDSQCRYEVVARMTSLTFQTSAAPASCTPATNILGTKAFSSTALGQFNAPLQTAIAGGATNVLMQFIGLSDDTGANAVGFQVGILNATTDPAKGAWAGNNPIDWWFLGDHFALSMGQPAALLAAGIANHELVAGPGTLSLELSFGGGPAQFQMTGARLMGAVDGAPAPSVPAPPPAQLAAGLKVFETMTANGVAQGLCGNFTVASLAQIPVPAELTTGAAACSSQCKNSHAYAYCGAGNPVGPNCNSLLDVMVGGCQILYPACVALTNQTQPDVAGAGAVKSLVLDAHNKALVPAGDGDAYSAYLGFSANRAHLTGESCTLMTDCQTGKACSGGICK